jgi:hypothetical protein
MLNRVGFGFLRPVDYISVAIDPHLTPFVIPSKKRLDKPGVLFPKKPPHAILMAEGKVQRLTCKFSEFTAGDFGASRPLRRIPAIVSFLNPQPVLSLVGGNRSSCRVARRALTSGRSQIRT